jgi:hypothetical protein
MTKRESAQQSRQHSLAEGTISLNQLKDQLAVSRNQVSDSLDQCVFICPCDSTSSPQMPLLSVHSAICCTVHSTNPLTIMSCAVDAE